MLILVIRTLILYLTVIISMRIMGKRQIGELQPSELVVAIMISDLASVPMQSIDIPILSGIVPVLTLIVAEVMMSYLSVKSKKMRTLIAGEPSVIIYNGHINEGELKKLRFNINDLLEELRLNNIFDISEVDTAIIETSGKLSVIQKERDRGVTLSDLNIEPKAKTGLSRLIIDCGQVNTEELSKSGKNMAWVIKKLNEQNIPDIKDVLIAVINREGELYIQKKGEVDKK
ncbi:MAG: DUF421 domain-containing protein [Clostridia bacterium]|nr:DUF421 domain-containing protein [Clostridia bacterium]